MVWGGGADVKKIARGKKEMRVHQSRLQTHHFSPMYLCYKRNTALSKRFLPLAIALLPLRITFRPLREPEIFVRAVVRAAHSQHHGRQVRYSDRPLILFQAAELAGCLPTYEKSDAEHRMPNVERRVP
jgi:hypothetical protein